MLGRRSAPTVLRWPLCSMQRGELLRKSLPERKRYLSLRRPGMRLIVASVFLNLCRGDAAMEVIRGGHGEREGSKWRK